MAQGISVEDLLAQASLLKANIDALQKIVNDLNDALSSVTSAKEAVGLIKKGQGEFLMALDRRGNVIVKVNGLENTKVLIHLGLNYYAEVGVDKAEEILNQREAELKKSLESANVELAKNVEAYNEVATILNQIQEELRRQQQK